MKLISTVSHDRGGMLQRKINLVYRVKHKRIFFMICMEMQPTVHRGGSEELLSINKAHTGEQTQIPAAIKKGHPCLESRQGSF